MNKNTGNPKDAIGATKIPLGLIPATALAIQSLAHHEGNVKYGRWNWRGNPVRASIYVDACKRHMEKWINGEWADPTTKVPHLGSAIACLNIIIDAKVCGTLIDDRPPSVDYGSFEAELMLVIANLDRLHADKMPRHYTQQDIIPTTNLAMPPLTMREYLRENDERE